MSKIQSDSVLSEPVHLGQWLQTQGFKLSEGPTLNTGVKLFNQTFEVPEDQDAISWVAQVTATFEWIEISFWPYFEPDRWPQIRVRLIQLIANLFGQHGVSAPLLSCLELEWPQIQDTQFLHAGTQMAVEVPEAEADQDPEESGEVDFATLTVKFGRALAEGEWANWCNAGPMHLLMAQALASEQSLIAQCREFLRAHQHSLAEDELKVLFNQGSTCVLTSTRGFSMHLAQDPPSVSIVHADGRVEVLE